MHNFFLILACRNPIMYIFTLYTVQIGLYARGPNRFKVFFAVDMVNIRYVYIGVFVKNYQRFIRT